MEKRHSGLEGIIAINTNIGFSNLVLKLSNILSKQAPIIGIVPEYESPSHRFLQGRGEIKLGENGPATTLWEFLIHAKDSEYPLYLEGNIYGKDELLLTAAQLLPHIPIIVKKWVGEDGYEKIRQIIDEHDINLKIFGN